MPIITSVPITKLDQPSFHLLDEVVTGIAFDVQNEFGRYFDERLYQTEMDRRFHARGIPSVREMKVIVIKRNAERTLNHQPRLFIILLPSFCQQLHHSTQLTR